MKKSQELLINVCLVIGTVVLFFAASEVLLRVTGIQKTGFNPPRIYTRSDDPRISYELQPNMRKRAYGSTITTNSLGLRSPEPEEGKPIIAVLGDSITFGYGLDDHESIPANIQELLPEYAVLNGGVPGYFLPQEAALYKKKIAPLQPTILILLFFFNDLTAEMADVASPEGFIHPPNWTHAPPECSPIEQGILGMIPGKCWLDLHSATYRILEKLVTRRSTDLRLSVERKKSQKKPLDDPVTHEQLTRYERQLAEFAATLPPTLSRLFVIWPDRLMHTVSRPALKEIAEKQGFAVFDLYDVFDNEPETRKGDSIHPSAKTTKEAAAAIYETLNRHAFLTQPQP